MSINQNKKNEQICFFFLVLVQTTGVAIALICSRRLHRCESRQDGTIGQMDKSFTPQERYSIILKVYKCLSPQRVAFGPFSPETEIGSRSFQCFSLKWGN